MINIAYRVIFRSSIITSDSNSLPRLAKSDAGDSKLFNDSPVKVKTNSLFKCHLSLEDEWDM